MTLTPQQEKNLGIFLARGHVKWEEIEAALDIKIALGQSPLRIIPPIEGPEGKKEDG